MPKHGCGAAQKRLWQVSVPGMPYNIVREEEYNHVPYCYRETQTRKVPFGEGNSEAEAGQGVLLGVSETTWEGSSRHRSSLLRPLVQPSLCGGSRLCVLCCIAWVQYYSVFLSPIPQGSGIYIPSGEALSALFGALYGLLWSITESIIPHITEHYPPTPIEDP